MKGRERESGRGELSDREERKKETKRGAEETLKLTSKTVRLGKVTRGNKDHLGQNWGLHEMAVYCLFKVLERRVRQNGL